MFQPTGRDGASYETNITEHLGNTSLSCLLKIFVLLY